MRGACGRSGAPNSFTEVRRPIGEIPCASRRRTSGRHKTQARQGCPPRLASSVRSTVAQWLGSFDTSPRPAISLALVVRPTLTHATFCRVVTRAATIWRRRPVTASGAKHDAERGQRADSKGAGGRDDGRKPHPRIKIQASSLAAHTPAARQRVPTLAKLAGLRRSGAGCALKRRRKDLPGTG